MGVRVDCTDCPFDTVEPTARLAMVISDQHELYNGHDVKYREAEE